VFELGLLLSLGLSTLAGFLLGFPAGLVPGLHMNNIAAVVTAYGGASVALFEALGEAVGANASVLLIACFISAALTAHLFASSITSTYVGIPSEDVVSVLPAHRLAMAGLGQIAVRSSVDGALAGIVASSLLLFPICFMMGPPLGIYDVLRKVMFFVIVIFSGILLLSEGFSAIRFRAKAHRPVHKVMGAVAVFLLAGILGMVVFRTNYYACSIPDLPWLPGNFVPRSSLLLPMFAGLFGIPGLLLSLGSRAVSDIDIGSTGPSGYRARPRDFVLSSVGGIIVGWLPGMTSGSAATLCAPASGEVSEGNEIEGALRFIWLYSSITAAGAVFAVGALFVIARARSGSMDAIAFFLGEDAFANSVSADIIPMTSILLAMVLSALISHCLLVGFQSRLVGLRRLLCSRKLAIGSLFFVACLSIALTGTRGALLMATSATLGIVPPLTGIRRIQLMGCLLVPIAVLLLSLL
jgi:putative membrane protein